MTETMNARTNMRNSDISAAVIIEKFPRLILFEGEMVFWDVMVFRSYFNVILFID